MKTILRVLAVFFSLCSSAWGADTGSSLFPHGAQNYNSSGTIKFINGGTIYNAPSNVLPTYNLTTTGSLGTCGNSNCVKGNTTVSSIVAVPFKTSVSIVDMTVNKTQTMGNAAVNSYRNITVNGGTLNVATQGGTPTYYIQNLTASGDATINLVPGDYWIQSLNLISNVTVNVVGTGTARVYVLNDIDASDNVTMPAASQSAHPSIGMFLHAYGNITIRNFSYLAGTLYSQKKATLDTYALVYGALAAQDIVLQNNAYIYYDGVAVEDTNYGGTVVASSANKLVWNYSNQGINCLPLNLSLKALSNGSTATNYNNNVLLNTQSGKGTWSLVTGAGNFVDATADDGLATYSFVPADNGQAVFALNYMQGNPSILPLASEQGNAAVKTDGSAGNIVFSPFGFLLSATPAPNPGTGILPLSFAKTLIAGNSDTIYLTAFGQTPSNPACGVIQSYTGNKSLKFYSSYINPSSGTLLPMVNTIACAGSLAAATNQTVVFTNGQASVNYLYRDVGAMKLSTVDSSVTYPVGGVSGSTANFVVKPANLITTVSNNPGASTATGPIFVKAGAPFSAQVKVVDSAGNLTPNFGNETIPEQISIQAKTLVLPISGFNGSANNGLIGNNSNFSKVSPGTFSGSSFSYDEVGIIKLTASLKSAAYLATDNIFGTETGNVGRFIPDHFDLSDNNPKLNAACVSGQFTYLDQPFNFASSPSISLLAKSLAGSTTRNYSGNFFRLAPSGLNSQLTSNSSLLLNPGNTLSSLSLSDQGNGKGLIAMNGTGLSFSRSKGTMTANFQAEIQLSLNVQDLDGVSPVINPYVIGGTSVGKGIPFLGGNNMYHGRLVINNAFGSAQSNLMLNIWTQYYTNDGFTLNDKDSCSVLTDINFISFSPNPSSLNYSPASLSGFSQGKNILSLSAPKSSGYVNLSANLGASAANLPWLQFDWPYEGNQDGLYDDNPMGRASFGLNAGHDNIIYQRENY